MAFIKILFLAVITTEIKALPTQKSAKDILNNDQNIGLKTPATEKEDNDLKFRDFPQKEFTLIFAPFLFH